MDLRSKSWGRGEDFDPTVSRHGQSRGGLCPVGGRGGDGPVPFSRESEEAAVPIASITPDPSTAASAPIIVDSVTDSPIQYGLLGGGGREH